MVRKTKITIYLILALLVFIFIRNKPGDRLLSNQSLKNAVDKSLQEAKGSYGIVVKNLKTDESYSLNEHKIYGAGSLYKVWIMAEAFNQIQRDEFKEDDVLSEDAQVLNEEFNVSSESAEIKTGKVTLSVKDALKQMITISHNYAALLLTEKIRLSKVALFLKKNSFNESKVGAGEESPTTTPSDMAKFWEKLYKGELTSQQYSQKMVDLLKGQTLNEKLPKYLPKEISIAHKTGEIGYFSHDAGIIYTPKGDYIIVILSETDYPPGAQERIAQVSKAVYEYFNR